MASPLDGERFSLWILAFMEIMAPPRSSSMAFGDDGPLRQGAREGLYWFLVAIEACGGGTSDLGYFLEVWAFIGEVGVENKLGGPTESPWGTGARPWGWACPAPSWGPRDSPPVTLRSSIFLYFPEKNLRWFSAHSENFLFLHINNTMVVLLKTKAVRVSSNQIIPKSYKTIVNMAWILHKLLIRWRRVIASHESLKALDDFPR